MSDKQQDELDKYDSIYKDIADYRMGAARYQTACRCLADSSTDRISYLDVGCGRGEMLEFAEDLGFDCVKGVEPTACLLCDQIVKGLAWDIPFVDNSFEVVSLFDVIEHILYEDMIPTLKELQRVASCQIIITASNCSSMVNGVELHINRLPYEEWNQIFIGNFGGNVSWLPTSNQISETWIINL